MAEFSGKIVDAYYFNEDYTEIEVIYDNNGQMTSYVLEADPNHPDMQDLEADGWDAVKLAEATAEYKKQQSNAYSESINIQVQERLQEVLETTFKEKKEDLKKIEMQLRQQQKTMDDEIYTKVLEFNKDTDYLFKFKLWALEQDFIKSAPKEVKTKIRKCKTIIDGFAVVSELLNVSGDSET